MAAASSDYFVEVGNPGSATTLSAPGHAIAGTAITVGSTSNWPTITGVIFAIDTVTLVNGVEVRDVGSYTEWEGIVTSPTTVGSLVLRYGTDQNYPAGSTTRVYIPVASSKENRLSKGILMEHNQDGTHGDINADSLSTDTITEDTAAAGVTIDGLNIKDSKLNTNNSVVTPNITDSAVTIPKIAYNTVPAFRAYLTSAQGSANGAVISLASEDYDNVGAFDTTTYKFTAPFAGVYHFSWNIQTNVGSDILSGISKNGTVVARGSWIKGSTFVGSSGSADLSLALNDYVQLVCVNIAGTQTVLNGSDITYLSGHFAAKV